MDSVKESLRHMIERMSDEEARQMLEFAHHLQQGRAISLTLKRLATDPTFKMPESEVGAFRVVEPIHGKGIAASRLLVDDRR
jgi:hypothetical protein